MKRKEKIGYLKRIAFGLSLSGLLEEYILKDTLEESTHIRKRIGKIEEPLFFSDISF
jgi:hypothetical protein